MPPDGPARPVAVTGASGVVGSALLRHLVAVGVSPVALSRSDASDDALRRAGAIPVRGDLLDPGSLRRAFDGADTVFHVAGVNELCSPDPSRMLRVNVDGTVAAIEAARAAGVRRIVHTSSAAAIGEAAGSVGTEDSPHRGWYLSDYERSKHLAEIAAREHAAGIELVIVNPSSVQGPGRATGTGAIVLAAARGRLPALVDGRLSIVDIDDCARGHLLAAARGLPGRRYLLNSFTIPTGTALRILADVLGRPVRVRTLPGWVASAAAVAVEAGFRAVGRRPPVCREMVRTLRHGHAYDGSRASRELGLAYTGPEDLLSRLVGWFRSEGLLAG